MTGPNPPADLLKPVEITYKTMLYGPGKIVKLYSYSEIVAFLLKAVPGKGAPPLLITKVEQR